MKIQTSISLTAKLLTQEIRSGSPVLIRVILKNISDSAIVVNKRMAVGYKNSLSRELYADLRMENDDQIAPYYESDINRDFSPESDYVVLKPDEILSETIDIMQFYVLKGPGKYLLTLYYQADEELASVPENLIKGEFSSNTVSFEVLDDIKEVEK